MQAVIDRTFCLKHPLRIARLFGPDVALGMLLFKDKTLLERVAQKYRRHRVAMPGALGNAYKVSALIEFRVAHIYAAMARRFGSVPLAHRLFKDLEEEEMEHGRLMLACLYQVALTSKVRFVPGVRDPEIRETLSELRRIEREVPRMSLEEALHATNVMEASEVNAIFGRLLKQVGKAQTELFAKELEGVQSHPQSVPRRIKALKEQLGRQGTDAA